jgi:Ca-activated chloride channel family protein
MFVPGPNAPDCCRKIAAVLVFLLASVAAMPAQSPSDVSAVPILPHTDRVTRNTHAPTYRSDVNLVLVNVTVLDHSNRAVSGLSAEDFALAEDKQPQAIKYFSSDDQPLSLAIVLDASSSMGPRMEQARRAVLDLVRTANPLDDVSVVIVGDKPTLAFDFADNLDKLPYQLESIRPAGRTALWDAMFLSLDQLDHARYQRRAMVVISDGGDNRSLYTESELKSRLAEADVELYAVGMFDRFPQRNEERRGPRDLDDLASVTGGRLLSVHDAGELAKAIAQINQELRNEYLLGYAPSVHEAGDKWRAIKVGLKDSGRAHKLRLYAKKGYFSAAE